MGATWAVVLCAVLAAVTGSCRNSAAPARPALPLDDPAKAGLTVLEIENRSYTNADFLAYVRATIGDSWRALDADGASRLFDDFADRKILVFEADTQGIVLSEAERASYRERLRVAMGGDGTRDVQTAPDPRALDEALLAQKYLAMRIQDVAVSDADVADYYGRHKADFLLPERLQVSQILLPAEGKASEIRDRLKDAGEEEFRTAARTDSVGPEAVKGGIMGTFSPGQLPPELEQVIFSLKAGEISRVVESSYGFHIFRVDFKTDFRLLSLDEAGPLVRARILEERGKEAVAAHLAGLKSTLIWTSRTGNLPFAYQRIVS